MAVQLTINARCKGDDAEEKERREFGKDDEGRTNVRRMIHCRFGANFRLFMRFVSDSYSAHHVRTLRMNESNV